VTTVKITVINLRNTLCFENCVKL